MPPSDFPSGPVAPSPPSSARSGTNAPVPSPSGGATLQPDNEGPVPAIDVWSSSRRLWPAPRAARFRLYTDDQVTFIKGTLQYLVRRSKVPPEAAARDETEEPPVNKNRVRLLYFVFMFQKFCGELLGTLFLVTSIALADKGSHGVLAPFSVSAVVYVLTFLFLPISGAHFNPAVSTAMFLTSKHFRYRDYGAYFICQLVGGTCGALLGWAIMGEPLEVLPLDAGASSARTIFHEVIPTILLIYTCLVLSYATNAGDVSLLTIPLTASMAVLFGAIAGATMNPAVAVGIYMSHLVVGQPQIMTRELLIGIFCPFLGALLSVLGFVVTHAYTNPIEIRFIHFI
ncbi:hypothetical protein ACSSS7_002102 [Eimeria intestinalis]